MIDLMAPVGRGKFWGTPPGGCFSSFLAAVWSLFEHSRTGDGTVCRIISRGGARSGGYTADLGSRSSGFVGEGSVVVGVEAKTDARISWSFPAAKCFLKKEKKHHKTIHWYENSMLLRHIIFLVTIKKFFKMFKSNTTKRIGSLVQLFLYF